MNTVAISGNLTRDPELRTTQAGKSVCNFTVAISEGRDKKATFVDCIAWEKQADFVAQWFHKGRAIEVEGRLQQEEWDDKDGNKRRKMVVVAGRCGFSGNKSDNNDTRQQDRRDGYTADKTPGFMRGNATPTTPPAQQGGQDDDIPF